MIVLYGGETRLTWNNIKFKYLEICEGCAGFEVYMVVNIQVEVFWVVTPCSVVVGYQRLRGSLLPLSATGTSETVKGST
jgi:hypothetical protein